MENTKKEAEQHKKKKIYIRKIKNKTKTNEVNKN